MHGGELYLRRRTPMTKHCDVLIVGAGPTGLVLALWLAKLGVIPRIIDKAAEAGTTSRALAVQARTLELYRQLNLTDTILARGHKIPAINLWVKGEPKARLAFENVGAGLTPYPFLHIFPQDQHERLLIERLQELGVAVERRTEFLGYTEQGARVVARLRGPDGVEDFCEATYLAGCDGARSRVREAMGTGFPGGTYRQVFYVADVDVQGPVANGELHIDLDEADFLAVFPLAGEGRARFIGTVRDQRADNAETLQFEDVSGRAIEHLKARVEKVNWFSTYRVHHRVSEHFRHGHAFVLGDAAHIHSPAGGQGMNTGIGDAVNLAWKLQSVLTGRAPGALLDSYEAERIKFARRLVATTDKVFGFVSADGRLADVVRTRIAPVLMPRLIGFDFAREYLFRTVSQIMLNYRGGPLSAGNAGHVHGGDRLPWAESGGSDNFTPLADAVWQTHVYGSVRPELATWCAAHRLPLHRFDWSSAHETAGLARDAVYLVRPDTYVALADTSGTPTAIERYFTEHGLRL
jgi:2-polyprenyl-6-methoxyphenol hydroxylase-like FAD-dependent oxidoreductase